MPFKDPEKRREYFRNYAKRKYAEKTQQEKDEINRKKRQNYQKKKEYITKQKQEYRKTEKYKKQETIYNWKRRDLIETWYYTYDSLYEYYKNQTHCELCKCVFAEGKSRVSNSKCMHHNHKSNEFEMIVCHACNLYLG